MPAAHRIGMVLAAATALAVSVGGAQAVDAAKGSASTRVRTAFDVLPKSDRLAVQAAETMRPTEAEACKGRDSGQMGRVCTAHILIQASQTGRIRFITVDRQEGPSTTVLTRIPVTE